TPLFNSSQSRGRSRCFACSSSTGLPSRTQFFIEHEPGLVCWLESEVKTRIWKMLLTCCYRNRILSSLRMSHKSRLKGVLNLFPTTGDSSVRYQNLGHPFQGYTW